MLADIIMWAGLALLVGFVGGFKLGTGLSGDGMDYHRGVMAGYELAKGGGRSMKKVGEAIGSTRYGNKDVLAIEPDEHAHNPLPVGTPLYMFPKTEDGV